MINRRYSRSGPETVRAADLPTVSVRAGPADTVVRLAGEWDLTVCDRLRAVLADQLLAGTRNLVVDLSEVTFLDLSCLHALLEGGRMVDRSDGTMQLVSPQPVVARLMTLLGVDHLFASAPMRPGTPDRSEATRWIGLHRRPTRFTRRAPGSRPRRRPRRRL